MRVLFVGTLDFSHYCLGALIGLPVDIAAVVTDTPEQNTFNSDYRDLRPLAESFDIPTVTNRKISEPASAEWVRSLDVDAIFIFGWSRMIPTEVLSVAPLGGLGSHPSPLPVGRGRHPLVWTILKGLEQGALTFLRLTDEPDAGPILAQEPFPVTRYDDAGTLYDRTKGAAQSLLPTVVHRLDSADPGWMEQDEDRATVWRKRGEEDGLIDWTSSSQDIYDLARALTRPYVGAHTFLGGQRVTIWKVLPPFHESIDPHVEDVPPGTVVEANDRWLQVKTGTGAVKVVHWATVDNRCEIEEGDQFQVEPGETR